MSTLTLRYDFTAVSTKGLVCTVKVGRKQIGSLRSWPTLAFVHWEADGYVGSCEKSKLANLLERKIQGRLDPLSAVLAVSLISEAWERAMSTFAEEKKEHEKLGLEAVDVPKYGWEAMAASVQVFSGQWAASMP